MIFESRSRYGFFSVTFLGTDPIKEPKWKEYWNIYITIN
jgi:hypothetical protein